MTLALAVGLTTSPALAAPPRPSLPASPPSPTSPASPTSAADGTGLRTGGGLDRYYHQRLSWGTCMQSPEDTAGQDLDRAGVQCADVTVPLDYAAPRGRTITVAISRLKATDTRHRIGSILLNNGGPGGPAVDSPPAIRKAMNEVGPRYDIIGFDPRFVGRSTPLDCDWPVSFAWFSAGASRAGFDRQVALSKSLAAKCRATNASVLPHVTTRNTARDMDVIRGALGERKISYLGYSYGTYLGTVYTQMFPGRYDRMVLDGALSPDDYGPRLMKNAVRENDEALSAWATWAAARHTRYGLGRSRTAVLATIDHVMAKAARGPLTLGTAPDVFRVDDTHIPTLLFMGVADDTDGSRAFLAEQVKTLHKATENERTALPPDFAEMLRFALTGADSSFGSAQTAIICGDVRAPRDPEVYWRDIQRTRTAHPLFGPLTENIGPCAFWNTPREAPTRITHGAPALIVAATGDPRTTYRSSTTLHAQLPGSRLLTLKNANRHALYGEYGNACVDDKVNRYLATGKLPRKDETCVK
ncbi:alpha/beta hydrolase [Streptomyces sp. KAI-26]|uniref:alpha/beta hydrolase n=1 Tax=Streptomyces sp. KAI-26 TaxID=1169747 RepID=UPI001587CD0F|nr:alpha/beta hydrolase [Streptomyces sp. KAI-26]NUV87732.1 alpha/beta hydrolase [Streptomyces sp. KAI-26]NUW20336.1 alpha/beta hydrolase [Streptomyces roseoviolaceus]